MSPAARARQKQTLTTEELETDAAPAPAAKAQQAAQVRASRRRSNATIAALVISLRAALDQSHAEIETAARRSRPTGLAAARKIAPAALAALPAGDVEAALARGHAPGDRRAAHHLARRARRGRRVWKPRLADIAHEEGYDGRVLIAADPAIKGADCRIEWRGGGSERSEAAIEAALDALIARRFSNPSDV